MKEPIKPDADRFAGEPSAQAVPAPTVLELPEEDDKAPSLEVTDGHPQRPTFREDEDPPDKRSEWAGMIKGLLIVLIIMAVFALIATSMQR